MSIQDIFVSYVKQIQIIRARERMPGPMEGEPGYDPADEERLMILANQIVELEDAEAYRQNRSAPLRLVYSRD